MSKKRVVAIYFSGSEKGFPDQVLIAGNIGNMHTIKNVKKHIKEDCEPKNVVIVELTPSTKDSMPDYIEKYNDVFSALMLVGNSVDMRNGSSTGFADIVKSAVMAGIEIGKKIK